MTHTTHEGGREELKIGQEVWVNALPSGFKSVVRSSPFRGACVISKMTGNTEEFALVEKPDGELWNAPTYLISPIETSSTTPSSVDAPVGVESLKEKFLKEWGDYSYKDRVSAQFVWDLVEKVVATCYPPAPVDVEKRVNDIVREELDDVSNTAGWHLLKCGGYAHDLNCPVVRLRRQIEARLRTLLGGKETGD